MTTTLKNVTHRDAVRSSIQTSDPTKLLPTTYAFADMVHRQGEACREDFEAKVLLHGILKSVFGPNYVLDGAAIQQELETTMNKTSNY